MDLSRSVASTSHYVTIYSSIQSSEVTPACYNIMDTIKTINLVVAIIVIII